MRRTALLLLVGCAASAPIPDVRFANAPPVEAVDDRRDVPAAPAEREFVRFLYHYDGSFHRRVTRALELPRPQRALGINALDEVPDSTWFTNRIGRRAITPEEIAASPRGVGSPEAHRPWTIISTKVGGQSVGFIIEDARGEKWLLKFDLLGFPEVETATHVIVGKLLWAFGYNVTEDHIVYFRRSDLVLGKKAVIKDVFGNKRPLDADALARRLALVDTGANGQIRGLASHMLEGKPLGGHAGEGTRPDDPNDRIPHELRRDLRGAYSVFAWLDHTDIQEGNFLDMWVQDPRDPRRRYVKHYLLDFGKSLGFLAASRGDPRVGYEYYADFAAILRSFATLGILERAWEPRTSAPYRGVSLLDASSYDPGAWKAASPAYLPLVVADDVDKLWGARILIRFTREQIRAAVEAGRLTDPRAAAFVTDTLIARQRATARYWFERVAPIDRVIVTDRDVCFEDLSIVHGFTPARGTRYSLAFHDRAAKVLARSRDVPAAASGSTCAPLTLAPERDGYTIIRLDTERPAFHGTTYVHVAREPEKGTARVVGIWRP